MDSRFRLAHDQRADGACRSRRRLAGPCRNDRKGARRPAGAEPRYKFGVAHLYTAEGVPCVPIALNSGLFWPRRSLRRFPGTVIAEILDPIAPGLDKDAFFARLQNDIEAATARLIAEGRAKMDSGG